MVQPQLLPPPFAGQPAVVLKHAHFSWGDGEGERGCTLRDISLKVFRDLSDEHAGNNL